MDSESPANRESVIEGSLVKAVNVETERSIRLYIDIPIEAGDWFITRFTWPSKTAPVPVAIAPLNPEHAKLKKAFKDSVELEKKGGRLARQAGMLCNEPSFWRFLTNGSVFSDENANAITNADDAKRFVYDLCGVETRKELDHNDSAASNWRGLESEYQAWMQV